MGEFPKFVQINEEGPREGFQIEKTFIPTERKLALIDALSATGVRHIQTVSFVNPKLVPNMADAEAVVEGFRRAPEVDYSALWLNLKGFERALATGRLDIAGRIALCASEPFLMRNQRVGLEENLAHQDEMVGVFKSHGIAVEWAVITAAFGCNFAGDIPVARVLELAGQIMRLAERHDIAIGTLSLADTMAWATPLSVRRVVGAVRDRYPSLRISLHLHDTRGMGIVNAFAGLEMGVDSFDTAVGGLGGCPFAGHQGAAGNLCTEDLVFMLNEMGIETGIDLERMIGVARLAEDIVGHPLPSATMHGGSLQAMRNRLSH